MIRIKSHDEIEILRQGGKILAKIFQIVAKRARPGVMTGELDQLAEQLMLENGGGPSFKNYRDGDQVFPAAICVSVNDQIVHGIPGDYILKSGDILGLDMGWRYPAAGGLYTDMAATLPIGRVSRPAERLIKTTKKALDIWIKNIRPGAKLNSVAKKVQDYVESKGYSVIRDLVGHGVGFAVHEEPAIPNYFIPSQNLELKQGMVLALEPMVSAGDYRIKIAADGWTASTLDASLAAHFEHTVAVIKGGCAVLTK